MDCWQTDSFVVWEPIVMGKKQVYTYQKITGTFDLLLVMFTCINFRCPVELRVSVTIG